MDYPKKTPNVGLVGGKFVDENATTGQPGSLIPAAWGNQVTDELLAVIRAAGLTPNEDDATQLMQAIQGISASDVKRSVGVATTGPIALSGLQTIDGIALQAGVRVLVKDQANAAQNGIYAAAPGAWVRANDADADAKFTPGFLLVVQTGTQSAGSVWQFKGQTRPSLGATALLFGLLLGKTGVAAGDYRKVSVDEFGRVIAGSNPTTLEGYGLVEAVKQLLGSFGLGDRAATGALIPQGTNLNSIKTPGSYGQAGDVYATLALNYPVPLAGTLVVRNASADIVQQTYRPYAGTAVYERTCYVDTWTVWDEKASTSSPALKGIPTAPTAARGTNTLQLATTAFVANAVADLIASAPGALDTLKELADALGNDPNFATTMLNALSTKAPLTSPALVGVPTAPTAAVGSSTSQLANTAFVQVAIAGLQAALGFKPVQQGGGVGQTAGDANKINVGWSGGGRLKATVDSTDLGAFIFDSNTAREDFAGVIRLATLAATMAGAEANAAVTPKSLRSGFYVSLGAAGYIVFPVWMGGFMVQWGRYSVGAANGAQTAVTFPIPFGTVLHSWAGVDGAASDQVGTMGMTNNGMTVSKGSADTSPRTGSWFALGGAF